MPDVFPSILIFGCGNMGGAMLRGWLAAGIPPQRFTIIDPQAIDLPAEVLHYRSPAEVNARFATVLLGIKPQMLTTLAPGILPLLTPDALIISILAGSPSEALSTCFPRTRILRLMPNLAAAIGKSPLALFSAHLDYKGRKDVDAMLASLGTPIWIEDETQMDAVTALAGSGPAFVYRFLDALALGGIATGLSPDVAARLALTIFEGAAQLAASSSESPAQLAARVTSPGGTTAAGLAELDKDGALQNLVTATLRAARDRGTELAKDS